MLELFGGIFYVLIANSWSLCMLALTLLTTKGKNLLASAPILRTVNDLPLLL